MTLQNYTIEDIVSEKMGRVSLLKSYGGVFEAARVLRKMAQSLPSNDNGTSLEDLGFRKNVPAFVVNDLAPSVFVPNSRGESYYTFPARPLKSGETLKHTFKSAMKGAGFSALTGVMAGQAYLFSEAASQSLPGACLFTSASGLGLAAGCLALHNLKTAYNYATVNTLGLGIVIHQDYEDFFSRKMSKQELLQSVTNSMKPVLYKA